MLQYKKYSFLLLNGFWAVRIGSNGIECRAHTPAIFVRHVILLVNCQFSWCLIKRQNSQKLRKPKNRLRQLSSTSGESRRELTPPEINEAAKEMFGHLGLYSELLTYCNAEMGIFKPLLSDQIYIFQWNVEIWFKVSRLVKYQIGTYYNKFV